MNHKRRTAAIGNFKNIIEALRFTEDGVYLSGGTLFNSHKAPTSLPWYIVSIVVIAVAVSFVLFAIKSIASVTLK